MDNPSRNADDLRSKTETIERVFLRIPQQWDSASGSQITLYTETLLKPRYTPRCAKHGPL